MVDRSKGIWDMRNRHVPVSTPIFIQWRLLLTNPSKIWYKNQLYLKTNTTVLVSLSLKKQAFIFIYLPAGATLAFLQIEHELPMLYQRPPPLQSSSFMSDLKARVALLDLESNHRRPVPRDVNPGRVRQHTPLFPIPQR